MARPAVSFLAVAFAAFAAGPALAQSVLQAPGPGVGPITAPDEIGYCLCAHQSVDALGAKVAAETQHHQEVQDRLAVLDKQLADSKANVNVNQPDQVEAYRRLVEAREKTMAEFYYELTPRLQQLVARYNTRSESYNAACTTRSFDATALDAAKAGLSCPVEP